MGYGRHVNDDPPLLLCLRFGAERRTTPSDAADVLQSLDDVFRVAERLQLSPGVQSRTTPDALRELLTFDQRIGHGDSPLSITTFRYGSPFDLVAEIPWRYVCSAAGGILAVYLPQIERLWNLPKRIRVESARLDAEEIEQHARYWRAMQESADGEQAYWAGRRSSSGRHLQGIPDAPAFKGIEGVVRDPSGNDEHLL